MNTTKLSDPDSLHADQAHEYLAANAEGADEAEKCIGVWKSTVPMQKEERNSDRIELLESFKDVYSKLFAITKLGYIGKWAKGSLKVHEIRGRMQLVCNVAGRLPKNNSEAAATRVTIEDTIKKSLAILETEEKEERIKQTAEKVQNAIGGVLGHQEGTSEFQREMQGSVPPAMERVLKA